MSLRSSKIVLACAAAAAMALLVPGDFLAAGRGEPGLVAPMRLELRDRLTDLALLSELDIDVDGVFWTWARVYLLPEEIEKLQGLGFALRPLREEGGPEAEGTYTPDAGAAVPSTYHTYETLTAELQQIAADHPGITRLVSIGKSVQGRDLWMMKVSKNPDIEEDEPEVRYIAAMHGDEVVGKEMCVNLIHLLTDGYGTDPRLTALVDGNEIWFLPSMNPDGTAAARRYNANNFDLNRNFPDQFDDPVDSPAGRAVETQHVMNWGYAHNVVLSANFHGGAMVANYPYDGTPSGSSVYSLSPDDALWVSLARTYADDSTAMRTSNSDSSFTNGVCNGADWYNINGGMQDWNYVWRGAKDITLEISNSKWPAGSQLPAFWEDNRESMLSFLERAREGAAGVVRDAADGSPLPATVHVLGNALDTYTDPDVGDFHRLLLPGTYTLEVASPGYATARVEDVVVVAGAPATRVEVDLVPLAVALEPVAHRVADAGDAALAPGETADLAVSLKNLGSAASGISAELVPAGWAADVVRAGATYPDLGAGASAESLDPHHAVALSPLAPPGSKAAFALQWTSNEGAGLSAPFFVPVGASACTTAVSTNVPKTVLDRQTASSTLTFPVTREISDVRVSVDVTHPYVGDLHVRVVSPSGIPVALHSRTGGSTDDLHGWYGTTLVSAEPLARLRGADAAGTWRLDVVDGVPLNTGSLTGWSVEVCGRPFEATLPAMRIHGVAKAAGSVDVSWWPYPGVQRYKVYRSGDPRVAGSFADVSASDPDDTDTAFHDGAAGDLYWLVSGVGPNGEGPIAGP